MTIAQRTPSTGTFTSGQTAAITLPASTAVGDILVVGIANVNTTGVAAPTGWTRTGVYTAGTNQSLSVFWAQYSVSLTLTFTNATGVSAWICNAFSQAGRPISLDGNPVAASNTTNNTTMATGAPTTGALAVDYEVLIYAWTSGATITAASGMTIDGQVVSTTAVGVGIGHNNTTSIAASTATTAFAPTLSASNTRKTGVGLLLSPSRVAVVGSEPNPTGILGRIKEAVRGALTGAQPFHTAILARKLQAIRSATGSQPSPTGSLIASTSAPPPAHLFEDTFDRADSSTIGGNWVEVHGGWEIVSNAVKAVSGDGSNNALIVNTTDLGTGNYKVTADVHFGGLWTSGAGSHIGLLVRYIDASNFYYLECYKGSLLEVNLRVIVGGSLYIFNQNFVPSMADDALLSLECTGNVLTIGVDGVDLYSVYDYGKNFTSGAFGFLVEGVTGLPSAAFRSVVVDATYGQLPVFDHNTDMSQYLRIYGPGGTPAGDLGVSVAPFACVCLIRTYAESGFHGIFGNGDGPGQSGGGGFWLGMSDNQLGMNVGTGYVPTTSSVVADHGQWTLVAAVARSNTDQDLYSYNYALDRWQHQHSTYSLTPTAPPNGSAYVAAWIDYGAGLYEPLLSDIAWVGLWSSDLSDGSDDIPASLQEFVDNGPWDRKADSDCTFFIAFDQDLTQIFDEAGIP